MDDLLYCYPGSDVLKNKLDMKTVAYKFPAYGDYK